MNLTKPDREGKTNIKEYFLNPPYGYGIVPFYWWLGDKLTKERIEWQAGDGLNFFFSDELNFGVRGMLWNDCFAQEFIDRKGYDVIPSLSALFTDIGDVTPKIRLDYYDVIVHLEEQNYFKPLFDWHESRGMIYGCDHGGRGHDVTEFGDYFRTQKYNQGPGCDQPSLQSDIVKNKVASSIAHLYERPRVWLGT